MTEMLFRVRAVLRTLVPLFCLLVLPATVHAAESVRLEEPDNATDGSNFGRQLDIDGDRMFVGSNGAGFIYGFEGGSWQLQAQLEVTDPPLGFGQPAVMEGDTVVIGSWAKVDGQQKAGMAYVFERDAATGAWQETAQITAETPVADDFFGSRLATDGDTIVLSGARYSRPDPVILERNADGEWVRETLIAGQADSESKAGSVAIDGDTLAVSREGEVHVYEDEGGEWVIAQVINEPGTLKIEGDTLLIAQSSAAMNPDRPAYEGRVLVYERGTDAWSHTATLFSPDAGPLGYFGKNFDIEDGLIAVSEGHETMAYYAYMKDENGDWGNFHARPPSGSDRAEFVPAISARSFAVAYNGSYYSHVDVFDVGELMAEHDDGDDNSANDDGSSGDDSSGDSGGSDDDDTGNGNDDDDGGNSDEGDDSSGSSGNDDEDIGEGNTMAASDDDDDDDGAAADDGGDETIDSDEGSAGSGDQTGDDTGKGETNGPDEENTPSSSGGGTLTWLIAVLMAPLLGRRRRSA